MGALDPPPLCCHHTPRTPAARYVCLKISLLPYSTPGIGLRTRPPFVRIALHMRALALSCRLDPSPGAIALPRRTCLMHVRAGQGLGGAEQGAYDHLPLLCARAGQGLRGADQDACHHLLLLAGAKRSRQGTFVSWQGAQPPHVAPPAAARQVKDPGAPATAPGLLQGTGSKKRKVRGGGRLWGMCAHACPQ